MVDGLKHFFPKVASAEDWQGQDIQNPEIIKSKHLFPNCLLIFTYFLKSNMRGMP